MVDYTREQAAIITSRAKKIVVKAGAGSGKTFTLREFARYNPGKRMLYLAYNVAIQRAAKETFPANVTCVTVNSLAYSYFGSRYASKLVDNLRPADIIKALGLTSKDYSMAGSVITVLRNYMNSDRDRIEDLIDMGNDGWREVGEHAIRAWEMMCDTKSAHLGMEHGGYLKLLQLSGKQFAEEDKFRCDYVLLDEFQDSNPATTSIVTSQTCGQIMVGDSHQQLYVFRGAVDAMDSVDGQRLALTGSFRFGEEIARAANAVLRAKGTQDFVRGLGPSGRVGAVPKTQPHAILCRTNAGILEAVLALPAGRPAHFVGGIDGYRFGKILDAYKLSRSDLYGIKDAYIRSFGEWSALVDCAEKTDDVELRSLIKAVNEHGSKLPDLIDGIYRRAVETPDGATVITTPFKAKGLDFDRVILHDDFMSPRKYKQLLAQGKIKPQQRAAHDVEMNLLYVAATRARKVLQPNKMLMEVL